MYISQVDKILDIELNKVNTMASAEDTHLIDLQWSDMQSLAFASRNKCASSQRFV